MAKPPFGQRQAEVEILLQRAATLSDEEITALASAWGEPRGMAFFGGMAAAWKSARKSGREAASQRASVAAGSIVLGLASEALAPGIIAAAAEAARHAGLATAMIDRLTQDQIAGLAGAWEQAIGPLPRHTLSSLRRPSTTRAYAPRFSLPVD
jgi:hypothetical protein